MVAQVLILKVFHIILGTCKRSHKKKVNSCFALVWSKWSLRNWHIGLESYLVTAWLYIELLLCVNICSGLRRDYSDGDEVLAPPGAPSKWPAHIIDGSSYQEMSVRTEVESREVSGQRSQPPPPEERESCLIPLQAQEKVVHGLYC